jgi:hypothetical protein
MLQAILQSLIVRVFAYILWVVLYPVAVVVCTPFIVIRAWILALVRHDKFGHAISDGYSSLSIFWWSAVNIRS